MRKFFLVIALTVLAASTGLAQGTAVTKTSDPQPIPNMGHAPARPDGIGRLDLRVFDADGNPIKGAEARLSSKRPGGFLCESWNTTDARGVAVLPPLHIGTLKLVVKARGYQTQVVNVAASELDQPVKVTLSRK